MQITELINHKHHLNKCSPAWHNCIQKTGTNNNCISRPLYTGGTLVVNIHFMGGDEGGMGLSLSHSSLASTDKCKHPSLNKQPLSLFPLSFSVIRSTFNYFFTKWYQTSIKQPFFKGAMSRGYCHISKIQLMVYYQCCVLIGWATTRLYVIAH